MMLRQVNFRAVNETAPEESKFAALPLIICIVGMLVSPYLIATFVPDASAGWTALGIFFVLTLGGGLWFGAIHKPTWWFPVAAGVSFMVARALYFQDGLFLYALGFALLAGLGTLLTGAGKLDLDDEESEKATAEPTAERITDEVKEVKHGEVGA